MLPDTFKSIKAANTADVTSEKARRKMLCEARYTKADTLNQAQFQYSMSELLNASLPDGMSNE